MCLVVFEHFWSLGIFASANSLSLHFKPFSLSLTLERIYTRTHEETDEKY